MAAAPAGLASGKHRRVRCREVGFEQAAVWTKVFSAMAVAPRAVTGDMESWSVCQKTSFKYENSDRHGIQVPFMVLAILIAMAVGCLILFARLLVTKLFVVEHQAQPEAVPIKEQQFECPSPIPTSCSCSCTVKRTRTVGVQTPVAFRWWHKRPRFEALRERWHGAWLEPGQSDT